jgi:hypothetical protein
MHMPILEFLLLFIYDLAHPYKKKLKQYSTKDQKTPEVHHFIIAC